MIIYKHVSFCPNFKNEGHITTCMNYTNIGNVYGKQKVCWFWRGVDALIEQFTVGSLHESETT